MSCEHVMQEYHDSLSLYAPQSMKAVDCRLCSQPLSSELHTSAASSLSQVKAAAADGAMDTVDTCAMATAATGAMATAATAGASAASGAYAAAVSDEHGDEDIISDEMAEQLAHDAMAAAVCAVMAVTSRARTIEQCIEQAQNDLNTRMLSDASVSDHDDALADLSGAAAAGAASGAAAGAQGRPGADGHDDDHDHCVSIVECDADTAGQSFSDKELRQAVASVLNAVTGNGELHAADAAGTEGSDAAARERGGSVKVCYCSDGDATARRVIEMAREGRADLAQIEVPPEQYDIIMDRLKSRIALDRHNIAECSPVKDPYELLHHVQKGELSYLQARNLASAGNLQSIHYDFRNNGIECTCSLGISFAVGMAIALWSGQSIRQAFICNLRGSAGSFLSSLLVSIASAQTLRVSAARITTTSVNDMLGNLYSSFLGREAIEKLALFSVGRSMSGAGAVAQVSGMLRSNIVAGAVTTAMLTAPDLYRTAFRHSQSWQQLAKNFTVNSVSVAGGTAGWMAGAAAGAGIGSAVPVIGTALGGFAGAFAGALAASTAASRIARKAVDRIRPDDSKIMLGLCERAGASLCDDYMLSYEEAHELLNAMSSRINSAWLRNMYASGRNNDARMHWSYEQLEPMAQEITLRRRNIILPDDSVLYSLASDVLNDEISHGALKGCHDHMHVCAGLHAAR